MGPHSETFTRYFNINKTNLNMSLTNILKQHEFFFEFWGFIFIKKYAFK